MRARCRAGCADWTFGSPPRAAPPTECGGQLFREVSVSQWSVPRISSRSDRVRSNISMAARSRPADWYANARSFLAVRVC